MTEAAARADRASMGVIAIGASLDFGDPSATRHALVAVMMAVTQTRERAMPVTLDTMDLNVIRNVAKPVPGRHVITQQGSVIRVRMVILGCFVTVHAVIPATAINVAGMGTARPDVHTTNMVHGASINALTTARPPQPISAVTTKETVCTGVSTDIPETTVTHVREFEYFPNKHNIFVPIN